MKILSFLFPPRLDSFKPEDLSGTLEYIGRKGRRGIERSMEFRAGWVEGEAQEKRVICLPGKIA